MFFLSPWHLKPRRIIVCKNPPVACVWDIPVWGTGTRAPRKRHYIFSPSHPQLLTSKISPTWKEPPTKCKMSSGRHNSKKWTRKTEILFFGQMFLVSNFQSKDWVPFCKSVPALQVSSYWIRGYDCATAPSLTSSVSNQSQSLCTNTMQTTIITCDYNTFLKSSDVENVFNGGRPSAAHWTIWEQPLSISGFKKSKMVLDAY